LNTSVETPAVTPDAPRARPRNPVPREGEGQLYSQSWFPICTSLELPTGALVGRQFLGGRVVAYRGEDGIARVTSAYCMHLGADLSLGSVVGNNVQCPFHHWEYGPGGACVKTGIGDPAPRGARLFTFPTCEKYGVVFAFNGIEPLFDLENLDFDTREVTVGVSFMTMRTDPWVFCANVPDFQHFIPVHRTLRDDIGDYDRIQWQRYGLSFEFTAFPEMGRGASVPFKVGVQGTSLIRVQGHLPDGTWFGTLAAMSLPRGGETNIFIVVCIRRTDDGVADQQLLEALTQRFRAMAAEDHELLETAHYCPGSLTRHDQALARYLEMLRRYPRANPARDFLR
jgi:nitrite reductase/ring-hydroxylating ferredoxin subunit